MRSAIDNPPGQGLLVGAPSPGLVVRERKFVGPLGGGILCGASSPAKVASVVGAGEANLRIAEMIESLFQPTGSVDAASRSASGARSCPRGFTAMIGFLKSIAASISD